MLQICAKFYFLMLALRAVVKLKQIDRRQSVSFLHGFNEKFAEPFASEYFSSLIKSHPSPQSLKVFGKLCLDQKFIVLNKTKFGRKTRGKFVFSLF